jgi:hypothetical protein
MYDVRTSHEAQGYTVCYGDSFTLLIGMMFVPHRKHKDPLSRRQLYLTYVYEVRNSQEAHAFTLCYGDSITLLICMMFVPRWKHRPPQSVTERALFIFTAYDVTS